MESSVSKFSRSINAFENNLIVFLLIFVVSFLAFLVIFYVYSDYIISLISIFNDSSLLEQVKSNYFSYLHVLYTTK